MDAGLSILMCSGTFLTFALLLSEVLFTLLKPFYSFVKELHKCIFVQVVCARLDKQFAVAVKEAVVGLGIGVEMRYLEIGVLATYVLLHFSIIL